MTFDELLFGYSTDNKFCYRMCVQKNNLVINSNKLYEGDFLNSYTNAEGILPS